MAKIKLTNGQILAANASINRLMQEKLPISTGYKLIVIAQELKKPVEIVNEARNNLIRKYGENNEKGQPVIAQLVEKKDTGGNAVLEAGKPVMEANPAMQKFADEYAEVIAQEVEINVEKIRLPEKVASTCDKCHHNMDRPLEIEPAVLVGMAELIDMT